MEQEKWITELFPGVYSVGNDASDTGGNQAVLIDRDGRTYLITTDGADYGSWLGKHYELTAQEREEVMNWEEGSYELNKWLSKRG